MKMNNEDEKENIVKTISNEFIFPIRLCSLIEATGESVENDFPQSRQNFEEGSFLNPHD